MTKYRLSKLAKADLSSIRDYTKRKHGARQCALYLHDLTACFRALAEHPGLGTACDAIRPGLRRQQQGRHIVFFVTKPYGVRIMRVLHKRMDQEHDFTAEEDL
jgi:toxin ParE1/3/4